MMAIRRSFSSRAAMSNSLSALASSGSESGGVAMISRNQLRSSESPGKYSIQSRNRRRRGYSHPTHPRPIQTLQQRDELPRRQPHHPLAQRRPAKRALFETLGRQNQARAVPEQQLHPVGPLGSKYIDHAAERVRAQRLVNHRREPVHPLAEIDRLHRDQDLHARGGNDHAAPFSARTILASVAPSAVNGTRATIAPTRISKTAPSSAAFSAGTSNITGAKPGASDLSIARPLADRRHPNSCCEVIP